MTLPDDTLAALSALAATPHLLVALDFDGTLAPLVDDPMSARMAPAAASAVDALLAAPDTTVAFVSGRTLEDLRVIAEHSDDSVVLLAGSHGAELWFPGGGREDPGDDDAEARAVRDRLCAEAETLLAGVEGAWVEPKAFGFCVHTRRAAAEAAGPAHARIDDLVRTHAPRWRRRAGHDIVEYAYRTEGKDAAVARLRAHSGATAVFFAGDDVTDEDALAALGPGDLGVRVGGGQTAARVRAADIAENAAILRALARMRAAARE